MLKAGRFRVIGGKSMRPVLLKLRGLKVPPPFGVGFYAACVSRSR